MPTNVPSDIPASAIPWIIGALVATILALSGVVAYLFKLYNRRTVSGEKQRELLVSAHNAERVAWLEEKATWDTEREAERERERAHYEEKHRELAEKYIEQGRLDREAHLGREEQIRREHADMMEKLAKSQSESATAMAALLQKMHDRFLGGKRRGG
jgi:hypothetical protein